MLNSRPLPLYSNIGGSNRAKMSVYLTGTNGVNVALTGQDLTFKVFFQDILLTPFKSCITASNLSLKYQGQISRLCKAVHHTKMGLSYYLIKVRSHSLKEHRQTAVLMKRSTFEVADITLTHEPLALPDCAGILQGQHSPKWERGRGTEGMLSFSPKVLNSFNLSTGVWT